MPAGSSYVKTRMRRRGPAWAMTRGRGRKLGLRRRMRTMRSRGTVRWGSRPTRYTWGR